MRRGGRGKGTGAQGTVWLHAPCAESWEPRPSRVQGPMRITCTTRAAFLTATSRALEKTLSWGGGDHLFVVVLCVLRARARTRRAWVPRIEQGQKGPEPAAIATLKVHRFWSTSALRKHPNLRWPCQIMCVSLSILQAQRQASQETQQAGVCWIGGLSRGTV